MAHFLVLPRELRNMVYENLYESACFTWKNPIPRLLSANIECPIVPVTKAIFPGSQASQEYLQAQVFRDLEMTIRLDINYWNMARSGPSIEAPIIDCFQAFELLGHAKHLNLLVILHLHVAGECFFTWDAILRIMRRFSTAMLRFSTIKVGIHYASGRKLPSWPQGNPPPLEVVKRLFNLSMNPCLLQDMTEMQRIAAYRLELDDLYPGDRGSDVRLEHRLVMIEARLYVINQTLARGRFWTREEVMDVFPVHAPPPGKLHLWARLNFNELERYTWAKNSLKEWRELKGSQTRIWAKKELWTNEKEDEIEARNC